MPAQGPECFDSGVPGGVRESAFIMRSWGGPWAHSENHCFMMRCNPGHSHCRGQERNPDPGPLSLVLEDLGLDTILFISMSRF